MVESLEISVTIVVNTIELILGPAMTRDALEEVTLAFHAWVKALVLQYATNH